LNWQRASLNFRFSGMSPRQKMPGNPLAVPFVRDCSAQNLSLLSAVYSAGYVLPAVLLSGGDAWGGGLGGPPLFHNTKDLRI
jgi:hypothetical protein